MGYRIEALAGDGLRDTYTHNNFAILNFSLTKRLKQILPGKTVQIASTKRFELCLVKQLLQSLEHEVPLFLTF